MSPLVKCKVREEITRAMSVIKLPAGQVDCSITLVDDHHNLALDLPHPVDIVDPQMDLISCQCRLGGYDLDWNSRDTHPGSWQNYSLLGMGPIPQPIDTQDGQSGDSNIERDEIERTFSALSAGHR